MADDINALLRQQILRPGQGWLQGAYVVTAYNGPYGNLAPYHTSGPLPPQAMYPLTFFAPAVPYGAAQVTSAGAGLIGPYSAQTVAKSGQIGHGQAPTSGIYTGVEDHCG